MTNINNLGDKSKRNLYEEAKARGLAFNKQVEEEKRKESLDIKLGRKSEPSNMPAMYPNLPAGIVLSDYVRIPGYDVLIKKKEEFKRKEWAETHFELAKNGLFMPRIDHFMNYFMSLRNAAGGKSQIYDGHGERLIESETQDLWESLSLGYGDKWYTFLDAIFKMEGGKGFMKTDHRVIEQKLEYSRILKVDFYHDTGFFVDLKFDSNGLPISRSKNQTYERGKNIHFFSARDISVAGFGAHSEGATLHCDYNPSISSSKLGVFPCLNVGADKK